VILSTQKLSFKYTDSAAFNFPDLQLNAKETLLVLGKSGSGKTTLLHLLAGFLHPTHGNVFLKEQAFTAMKNAKRDLYRGKHLGIVFQQPHFVKSLTAIQNVRLAAMSAKTAFNKTYVLGLFEQLGLRGKENKYTSDMSVGEQQRVNIIRALANKPELLLADEPTSALDDENCNHVVDLLKQAAAINNSALIIVTHDQRIKSQFKNTLQL